MIRRIQRPIPGVDPQLLVKDAAKLLPDPARRLFLRGASLGMMTFLTGCDIVDSDAAEGALRAVSRRRRARNSRTRAGRSSAPSTSRSTT